MPKHQYQCPRCGYTSFRKDCMIQHFKRKIQCPNEKELALTPEIIEVVLREHKYYPPPKTERLKITKTKKEKSVTNIINNYNTVCNFVSNKMSIGDKIQRFLDYQQKPLLDFEDNLERQFESKVNKLDNDQCYEGDYLNLENLLEIFNHVTKVNQNQFDQFNVFFDKPIDQMKFYRSKQWDSFLSEIGIKKLVSLIKSYFLDRYEIFLIRNLHQDHPKLHDRVNMLDHLKIYYGFIAVFDLEPYVSELKDVEILGHRLMEYEDHYLASKYQNLYQQQKQETTISDKNKIRQQLIRIIKTNTVNNSKELNCALLEIVRIDHKYRSELMKLWQISDPDTVDQLLAINIV